MENEVLREVVTKHMPYGKYKGFLICDIPEHYLVWMKREGFPEGKLGMWLSTMYEIRLNGLEYLLKPYRDKYAKKM